MIIRVLLLFILLSGAGCLARKAVKSPVMEPSPYSDDPLLVELLNRYPVYFDTLLKNRLERKISFIYTTINRDENNEPIFTDHYFGIDTNRYFYPASTVKLPAAILALQKLRELNIPGLDRNTTMVTEAGFAGQTPVFNDPTAEDGRPCIGHYIKKIFLASDNDAFNRLYEFLGQEYLNQTLHQLGYDEVQILHRLNISLSEEANRTTNPVLFYDSVAALIYRQDLKKSLLEYVPRHTLMGNGYIKSEKLVPEPFDFSIKNRITLPELHRMLRTVLFPASVPPEQRFGLKEEDYDFLYRYMSMKPGESAYPSYDTSFNEAYSKFLMYGGKGEMDPSVRIFNKEGDAYGFLTDIAYIVDFDNGIEFLLSANIYCNSDGIFNDDHYDYDSVGLPFLKNLGRVIYEYEKERKKERLPQLSRFRFDYKETGKPVN